MEIGGSVLPDLWFYVGIRILKKKPNRGVRSMDLSACVLPVYSMLGVIGFLIIK